MKKTLLALITISIIPTTVLANESKNGVYISAKMGASIQQMSGQFFPTFYILEVGDEEEKFAQKLKGNNHRTAVFGTGFALGYDFYENFNIPIRTELDFTTRGDTDDSYSGNDVVGFPGETFVKNQIDLNTLMLNAYYDFKNSSNFTPYLSAGLGYAYISQKTSVDFMVINPSTGDKSDRFHLWTRSHATNNFAWSAGAGIKYTVNKDFSFDLNYKYLNAGQGLVSNSNDIESKRDVKTTLKTHDIMLSATYHF